MRTILLFATLGSLLLGVLPAVSYAQDRGDVNGDATIDGRDALRVMRVVQGLETTTDTDIERGDVYPVPGTEGRLVGDGQLTVADARRLLRVSVGLIAESVVTGRFERPTITDFAPSLAAPGDTIRVEGSNFVPDSPAENIVFFGSTPGRVVAVDGATLLIEVPAGATAAPLTILAPGGVAESVAIFTPLVPLALTVDLPGGRSLQDYTLLGAGLTSYDVDAAGTANVFVPQSGLYSQFLLPNDTTENVILFSLGLGNVSAGKQADRIDVRSTAEAMLFMAPHIVTSDTTLAGLVMQTIGNEPAVNDLADVLQGIYDRGAEPTNDPAFIDAYQTALRNVLDSLPVDLILDTSNPAGKTGLFVTHRSSPTNHYRSQVFQDRANAFCPDLDILKLQDIDSSGRITLGAAEGNPLDWYVRIVRVDDPQTNIPRGFADLRDPQFWRFYEGGDLQSRALPYEDKTLSATFVSAASYLRHLDFFGNLMVTATDFVANSIAETTDINGLTEIDDRAHIPLTEDAVYLLHAFSGVRTTVPWLEPEDEAWFEGAFVDQDLPDGYSSRITATLMNMVFAASDVMSVFLGANTSELAGGSFRRGLRVAIQKGRKVAVRTFAQDASQSSYEDLARAGMGFVYGIAQDIIVTSTGELPGVSGEQLLDNNQASTLGKMLSYMGNAIDIGYKVSMLGRAGERVITLLGWNFLYEVTPLETCAIVVGDPFNPRITGFTPQSGAARAEVTISGERFGSSPDSVEVRFGTFPAKILSVQPNELKVEVPSMNIRDGQRPVSIVVETTQGITDSKTDGAGQFQYEAAAQLATVRAFESSPANAFGVFSIEAAYSGETVQALFVPPLAASDTGAVQIMVNGVAALQGTFEHLDRLAFTLPTDLATAPDTTTALGLRGKRIAIWAEKTYADGTAQSDTLRLILMDEPEITEVTPAAIRRGQTATVNGFNFGRRDVTRTISRDIDAVLRAVRLDTQAELLTSARRTSNGQFRFEIQDELPPGTTVGLSVETERDTSNTVTLTMLEGYGAETPDVMAEGFSITITTALGGFEPDGEVSADEAFAFASGAEDPFSDPWDDVNLEQTITMVEQCKETNEDGDCIRWEWEVVNEGQKTEHSPGSHEREILYQTQKRTDRDGIKTEIIVEFDLDTQEGAVRHNEHSDGPEEGDFVGGASGGAAFTDVISTGLTGLPLTKSHTLNGDHLNPMTLSLSHPLTFENNMQVRFLEIANHGLRITGSRNDVHATISGTIDTAVIITGNTERIVDAAELAAKRQTGAKGGNHLTLDLHIASGEGVLVENQIEDTLSVGGNGSVTVRGGGAHILSISTENVLGTTCHFSDTSLNSGRCQSTTSGGAFVLQGESRFNDIQVSHTNPQSGLILEGAGVQDNTIIGVVRGSGGNGVVLRDGTQNNVVGVAAETSGGHGVVLEGSDTQHNTLSGGTVGGIDASGNGGHGVLIHDGASHNRMNMDTISGNTLDGIHITGVGTDYNRIEPTRRVENNGGSGVKIEGSGSDGPFGTIINPDRSDGSVDSHLFSGNPDGAVWITNLPSDRTDNVVIKSLYAADAPYGLRIDGGSQHIHVDFMSIRSITEAGVHISGPATHSIVLKDFFGRTFSETMQEQRSGIHITNGAHNVDIGEMLIVGNANTSPDDQVGLRIDKGAHSVTAHIEEARDQRFAGLLLDGAHHVDVTGEAFTGNQHGAVIRGGSYENTITGTRVLNHLSFSRPSLKFSEHTNDVIRIEGSGTRDNRLNALWIADNEGIGIHVRNNASATILGGQLLNDGVPTDFFGEPDSTFFPRIAPLVIEENALGVKLDGAFQATLTGAYVGNHRDAGIVIEGGSQFIELGGSQPSDALRIDAVAGRPTNATLMTGIRVAGESTTNVALENITLTGMHRGVDVNQANNVSIGTPDGGPSLDVYNVEAQGLWLQNVENVSVYGATLAQDTSDPTGTVGIHVTAGHDIILAQNSVSRFQEAGIRIDGVSTGLLIQNDTLRHNLRGLVFDEGSNDNRAVGNVITFNTSHGIEVAGDAQRNTLRGNRITQNGGLGIELFGGNDNLPEPIIDSWSYGTQQRVGGRVLEEVPRQSVVDVFSDDDGEGDRYLGSFVLRSDVFDLRTEQPYGDHTRLTAIVTDPDGNTSEFGKLGDILRSRLGFQIPMFVFTSIQGDRHNVYIQQSTGDIQLQMEGRFLPGRQEIVERPRLAPDGINILMASNWINGRHVWLVRPDVRPERLTDSGANYAPAWSPDGQRIVFVSERDGNPELYTATVDIARARLSDEVRLTNDGAQDREPHWSPDGQWIVFVSERNGNPELYRIRPDGTNLERLTTGASVATPAWSHDGMRLAYTNNGVLTTLDLIDGIETVLSTATLASTPAWTADGTSLLYDSTVDGDLVILRYDLATGQSQQIGTTLNGQESQPDTGTFPATLGSN